MTAEAHSFDISGLGDPPGDTSSSRYFGNGGKTGSSTGIFGISSMSQISSVQTIPPAIQANFGTRPTDTSPSLTQRPQLLHYQSSHSLLGSHLYDQVVPFDVQGATSQSRNPSTMIPLGHNLAALPHLGQEPYRYSHRMQVEELVPKAQEASGFPEQRQKSKSPDCLNQFLDAYNLEGAGQSAADGKHRNADLDKRQQLSASANFFTEVPKVVHYDGGSCSPLRRFGKNLASICEQRAKSSMAKASRKNAANSSCSQFRTQQRSNNSKRQRSTKQKSARGSTKAGRRSETPNSSMSCKLLKGAGGSTGVTTQNPQSRTATSNLNNHRQSAVNRTTQPLPAGKRRQTITSSHNSSSCFYPPLTQSLSSFFNQKRFSGNNNSNTGGPDHIAFNGSSIAEDLADHSPPTRPSQTGSKGVAHQQRSSKLNSRSKTVIEKQKMSLNQNLTRLLTGQQQKSNGKTAASALSGRSAKSHKSSRVSLVVANNTNKSRQQPALQNTGNSTLRRSATSSQMLRSSEQAGTGRKKKQRLQSSSGKLPILSKLREEDTHKCKHMRRRPLLQATMDEPTSHRSRCSACPSADHQEASSRHSRSAKSRPKSNRSSKKVANNRLSQLAKLKERRELLDKYERKQDAKRLTNADYEASDRLGERPPQQMTSGSFFSHAGKPAPTSSFEDQNHTATFQGSRKAPVLQHSRSASGLSVDKQIVNILTNSHLIGEYKRLKRTVSSRPKSLLSSSKASLANSSSLGASRRGLQSQKSSLKKKMRKQELRRPGSKRRLGVARKLAQQHSEDADDSAYEMVRTLTSHALEQSQEDRGRAAARMQQHSQNLPPAQRLQGQSGSSLVEQSSVALNSKIDDQRHQAAHTSSQQFLNNLHLTNISNSYQLHNMDINAQRAGFASSTETLVNNNRLEAGEPLHHFQSNMNTLGMSQSGRLSPARNYGKTSSHAHMTTLPFGAGVATHSLSQTTTGPENHLVSLGCGVSDHGASLETAQTHLLSNATGQLQQPGRLYQLQAIPVDLATTTQYSKSKSGTPNSTSPLRLKASGQNKAEKHTGHSRDSTMNARSFERLQQPKANYLTAVFPNNDGQQASFSARTPEVRNRRQVQAISNSLSTLAQNWTEAINALESSYKKRISNLRSKLTQIVDTNSTDLNGAIAILESAMQGKFEDAELPSNVNTVQTLLKNGFNFEQEKTIAQLQAELILKTRYVNDYHRLKRRYIQRKEEWTQQLRQIESQASAQRENLVAELQRQVSFYRTQAEDLGQRMRHDLKVKQQECENAVQGGQGFKQALIQTEGELKKLQEHVLHQNSMLQKCDAEIDRYRHAMEVKSTEMAQLECDMRRQQEDAVKQMKTQCKEKFKKQIEQIEVSNADSAQLRVQEVERNLRELHAKDIEMQAEKFELRLRTGYLEISEHENIVRQLQAREREATRGLLDEAQTAKETCLAHLSNDMRMQAEEERNRLNGVISSLESRLEDLRTDSMKALEEKERAWQEIQEDRSKTAQRETQEAYRKENDLRQQVYEAQHENRVLQQDIARLHKEMNDKAMNFQVQEEHYISEIKQLDARLEEQFKLSEQLAEARTQDSYSQQTIRELKEAIDVWKQQNAMQKQEYAQLEATIVGKDAALAAKDTDVHHLLKRINWVTKRKQAEIQSLHQEIHQIKLKLQSETNKLQAELKRQAEPILAFARQLAKELAGKDDQLSQLEGKFSEVLSQLAEQTKKKDEATSQIGSLTRERDALVHQVEKLQDKIQHEGQASKKQAGKVEQLRAKADHDSHEARSKIGRLEDRIANLAKLTEKLEAQLKARDEEIEALGREREADQKQHEDSMADKEKRLQEYFCKKLDRKLNRIESGHKRATEDLTKGHEQQIVLFEQEFQAQQARIHESEARNVQAQARIQELERQLALARGQQKQQRQQTRERDALMRKQTQQIEYEVSKSIDKALGRSAGRKGTQQRQQLQANNMNMGGDPYVVRSPNRQAQKGVGLQQMGFSQASNGSRRFQHAMPSEESPNARVSSKVREQLNRHLMYPGGAYASVGSVSQQHLLSPNEPGAGLNIYDLQFHGQPGQTAEFIRQSKKLAAANYRYVRASSSNGMRSAGGPRSKSGNHQLFLNPTTSAAADTSNDLDRENLPPPQIIQSKQQKLIVVHPDQSHGHASQQHYQAHEVFNPLLTIRPGLGTSSTSQSCANLHTQQQQQHRDGQASHSHSNKANNYTGYAQDNSVLVSDQLYSGTQDGNYSREGISRSFEAKLIQTNKDATTSEEQLDNEEQSAGQNNLAQHRY